MNEIPTPPDGAMLITSERRRQIQREGWTPEHDDAHEEDELARAAVKYIEAACAFDHGWHAMWPWEPSWWKPSDDAIRNLTKAGALIAAEIDRIRRIAGEEPRESAAVVSPAPHPQEVRKVTNGETA